MSVKRAAGAVCFVATAAVASACSDRPASPTEPASALATLSAPTPTGAGPVASSPAPTESAANFERDFLMDMINHHQMAVEMGEMCVMQAVHAELRSMCESIIATQSAEIDRMQGWLEEWYGISHEPVMKPGAMRQMEKLAALEGAEFEIAFMESMIRHHRGAIREGEKCVRRASHEELIHLCHDIIAAQTAEIQQMELWLCDWYGRCGGTS